MGRFVANLIKYCRPLRSISEVAAAKQNLLHLIRKPKKQSANERRMSMTVETELDGVRRSLDCKNLNALNTAVRQLGRAVKAID